MQFIKDTEQVPRNSTKNYVFIILMYIQQDATLHSLFYLETALHSLFITNSCTHQLKHFHSLHLKLHTLKMSVLRT